MRIQFIGNCGDIIELNSSECEYCYAEFEEEQNIRFEKILKIYKLL